MSLIRLRSPDNTQILLEIEHIACVEKTEDGQTKVCMIDGREFFVIESQNKIFMLGWYNVIRLTKPDNAEIFLSIDHVMGVEKTDVGEQNPFAYYAPGQTKISMSGGRDFLVNESQKNIVKYYCRNSWTDRTKRRCIAWLLDRLTEGTSMRDRMYRPDAHEVRNG